MTSHSNNPKRHRKAVIHSSSSLIRIRWNADFISNFVNHLVFEGCRIFSLDSGRGYRSENVIEFNPRQSTHKRNPPFGFLANRTGAAAGELLGRIYPLLNKSVIVFLSTNNSSRDMLYRGPHGGVIGFPFSCQRFIA